MFLFIIVIIALLTCYFYTTRNHNYWKKKNVKHDDPIPIFGNHWKIVFGIKSAAVVANELYDKYKGEKVIGYYQGNTPELIIADPDLVRQVLNVDFTSFYKRGLGRNPETEPLLYSLFHIDGDRWKLLRQRLTTAFTTSKLKNMFPLVVNCAEKLQVVVDDIAVEDDEYDVREIMARFTTEFIGACGFGIEMDSINNERSQFRELGRIAFNPPLKVILLVGLSQLFPEFTHNIYAGQKSLETALTDIFMRIRDQRKGKPIGRNDFIDLLLEMENNENLVGDSLEHVNPDGTVPTATMKMTLEVMVAQLFVFFVAGFETSSSATSYMLHELAFNPGVQSRIQEEVDEVMARHGHKLCYEAVEEMTLLKMAFKESMRIFPSLGNLNRVCAKKYTFPGLDLTIDPGTKILIPVQALQNDERYFKDPKQFNPDRFSPEEVQKRHNFVYLPFGEGPRKCIAARLGYMQSLAGLAAVLHKFIFEPSKSTRRSLEVNPLSSVVQTVKNGIPLKIKRRSIVA